MCSHRSDRKNCRGSFALVVSLTALALTASSTGLAANIRIGSTNTESVSFAVYNTVPGSNGQPVFNNGLMKSAGSSLFPALTSVNGTAQSLTQTSRSAFTHSWSANQNPPFSPPLSSNFGAATLSTSASVSLPKSGNVLNNQIGVSFNSGTFLQSSAQISNGLAAVSFGYLHADFTNSTGIGSGTYVGTPGAVVSATGVLSPTAGSFVELANQGTITIWDNTNNIIASDSFSIIVGFAFNSSMQQNTFLYGTGSTSLEAPDPVTGAFSILDTNLFAPVSIPVGGRFSVDSYLTLVSDPGSLIELTDFPASQGPLPDFGSYAGGAGAVPEPAAFFQLATGMGFVAGLWGWRRARQRRSRVFRLPRVAARLTLLLLVLLGLFAPALAPAGTITVNDLSQPISASSEAFATTSLSIDSINQKVTFDGTYLSTGGYPAQGDSVTYTVVFLASDGSQSDATMLTIAGMDNPSASANTSVEMTFEGMVSTPINPGTGIYFLSEPNGWFDVAAYLRNQGAASVPGDLSVLIATSAVPEPASLVMGGIAVLAGLGIAVRRRLRR